MKKSVRGWMVAGTVVALVSGANGAHLNPAVVATVYPGGFPASVGVNATTDLFYVGGFISTSVSVVRGSDNVVVATIPVDGKSHYGLGVNDVTNRIYVGNTFSFTGFIHNTVSVIDGTTNAVMATVVVERAPFAIGVNPVTDRVYVANFYGASVSVLDGLTNTVIATVPVGSRPNSVAVNTFTNRVYVPSWDNQNVSVIDGATNGVIAVLPLSGPPQGAAVNGVTNRVYVGNYQDNSVWVLDGYTNAIVASVPTGNGPASIDVNPVTNAVYVANQLSHTVSVIDGATDALVATVPVGERPQDVKVNSVTDRAYVANLFGNTVSVIADAADDVTPPTVTVPADLMLEATSPNGTIATFSTSAYDDVNGPLPTTCSPASGSGFSIGTTMVTCTATDTAGNVGTDSFLVTVLSPSQIISNLTTAVVAAGFQQASNLLQSLYASINSGNTAAACSQLSAFINQVQAQSGKQISIAQATEWILSATHARWALGCQ